MEQRDTLRRNKFQSPFPILPWARRIECIKSGISPYYWNVNWLWWWLPNFENLLKIIELYTLNGWIAWCIIVFQYGCYFFFKKNLNFPFLNKFPKDEISTTLRPRLLSWIPFFRGPFPWPTYSHTFSTSWVSMGLRSHPTVMSHCPL